MKKFALLIGLLLLYQRSSDAGLISRTYNYTDGNTISANENNTNENTLYTEVNGLLDAANIEDGTITNADVADTQFTRAKFASAVQSTFTYIDTLGAYRRPTLQFIGVATVDVENNTGTSNETCVQFTDQRRCVTENTASTSVNRRFIITEAAALSGTKNSGLFAGESEGLNLWYALYAVKVTDNATDFVIVGSTKTPVQANFATLNTNFGTNGWVYLGMIRNGDNSAATGDIINFIQTGNYVSFNTDTTGNVVAQPGIRLATTAGATSLIYTYAAGVGTTQIPSHLLISTFGGGTGSGSGATQLANSVGANRVYFAAPGSTRVLARVTIPSTEGLTASNGSSVTMDVFLCGFVDNVLGIGFNPLL